MINFQYVRSSAIKSALAALAKDEQSMVIAGGTNLVDLMKRGVVAPQKLVDINALPLKKVEMKAGALVVGALVSNSDLAENPIVREKFPLLMQALQAGASAQLRNVATVGGNMMQRTRCTYFYDIQMPCNKRQPGSGCSAIGGYNRMHAIFGTSPSCIAVHPSDMCVALAALDAKVIIANSKGERKINFVDFHRLPEDRPDKDNNLGKNELIVGLEIPDLGLSKHVHYLKVRDRSSYAFALVSVAVAMTIKDNVINEMRLAMGGVAHKPWRLAEVEKFLKGKAPSEANFKEAVLLAMQGAKSFGDNDFKLKLAPNTILEALTIAKSKA